MRLRFSVVVLVGLATATLAGCGGEEASQRSSPPTPPEESEKEGAADKTKGKASPFVGEHTDLGDGDTAMWNAGMTVTISDIRIEPNESRRQAEENVAKGRGAKNHPP